MSRKLSIETISPRNISPRRLTLKKLSIQTISPTLKSFQESTSSDYSPNYSPNTKQFYQLIKRNLPSSDNPFASKVKRILHDNEKKNTSDNPIDIEKSLKIYIDSYRKNCDNSRDSDRIEQCLRMHDIMKDYNRKLKNAEKTELTLPDKVHRKSIGGKYSSRGKRRSTKKRKITRQ